MSGQTGSCLCGAVQYVVSADFEMVGNCHCNTCKKITGGAFEAFAIIETDKLTVTAGKENMVEYRISPKAKKHFCGTCGTPVYNTHRHVPKRYIVHVGSLDDPTTVSPDFNLHCENMLPWVEKLADIENYQQGYGQK